jgi:hypothetical protein
MEKYLLMAVENEIFTAKSNNSSNASENEIITAVLYELFGYYAVYNNDKGLIVFSDLHKKGHNVIRYYTKLLSQANEETLRSYIYRVNMIEQENVILKAENTVMKTYVEEWEIAPDGPKYKEAKDHFEAISVIDSS